MKQIPKPIALLFFIIGCLLIIFVLLRLTNNSDQTGQQYLDEINVQTQNPQPAGRNITE